MKLKYGSFISTFVTLLTGLLIGIGLIMLVSCEDNIIEPIPPTYQLTIDSLLTEDGKQSIERDVNGYYLLDLESTSDTKQTVRRITGMVLKDSLEPTPPEVIDWESSHTWITGDTIGYIVRRVVNALGQWVIVDTNYINVPAGLIVPTINPTSISGDGGEINIMIAPIYGMKGDTMIVTARLWTPYNKTYYDTLKVILR
jgi:hypothetical protein